MMDEAKISVVIPTYNRADLTKRAVQSVLAQTYRNIELIVVDDGSTDNTSDVLNALGDDRIKYVFQKNSGACVARNNGILHASGEYIAFHDSDDIWHADKLEKQVAVLNSTQADVVFCRMNKIRNGNKVGTVSDFFKVGFLSKETLPFSIGTQTLIGKREVFETESFDVEMPRFQEFELLIRIQKKFSIYCMDECLVDYLLQEDSISNKPERYLQGWRLILDKHPDFLKTYESSRDRIACDVLKNAFGVPDKKMRKEFISLAFMFKTSVRMFYRLWRYKIFNR